MTHYIINLWQALQSYDTKKQKTNDIYSYIIYFLKPIHNRLNKLDVWYNFIMFKALMTQNTSEHS